MAINYTQSFNAGELSRKLDGRSDLELYKAGCRDLSNFIVLPQGGVERRAGTEFVSLAGTDGSTPARLIEFDFSSDIRFVIEMGVGYAKVHYTDSLGVDQVEPVTENDNLEYTADELRSIQFTRKYDTLILTCPTKETMIFRRDTIAPTFSVQKIAYTYPPTMEVNITSTTITASSPSPSLYTGTTTLTSTSDIFFTGHEGSIWAIDHLRHGNKKEVTLETNGTQDSDPLDVSFCNWEVETDGTWNGEIGIERSIAGATFEPYITIGDTDGGVQRNFKFASSEPEGANVRIRIAADIATSTMTANLYTDNTYHKGLVKITSVTNAQEAEAEILSVLEGSESTPTATVHWSEASFSGYRGFSPASEFFENRLWLAGSKDEPADLFASVFGDNFNFLTGSLSTDAIKRTIDSPEEPKWLEGKRYLFLGTAGTAVSIRSADKDSLISQSNITTLVENAYGSAALQAEVANDVVIYVQRDGLKLRELVFDRNQDTFVGNDLNMLSEDITSSGIVEMFLQKQPNQFVWCIKEDGTACVLTYERGQDVKGWARISTNGNIYSGASIHNGGEDTTWLCVERNGSYCIEKMHPRRDLEWYVDSGVQYNDVAEVTTVSNLDHLEGETVQVVTNGSFHSEQVVSGGSITIPDASNNIIVGLPYESVLRPMPIEPDLQSRNSQSRVKNVSKIITRFYNTKGAKVGEAGKQLTTYPAVDTQDASGQPVSLKTGQQRFFVGSQYEREKLIEVKQDLPYPMTVLSIASHVNAEGA